MHVSYDRVLLGLEESCSSVLLTSVLSAWALFSMWDWEKLKFSGLSRTFQTLFTETNYFLFGSL